MDLMKKYGKYILVIKESDEYKENSELFDNMHRLIENDYAFIDIINNFIELYVVEYNIKYMFEKFI